MIAVIGLGETGKPLFEIIKEAGLPVTGVDIQPVKISEPVDIMHICLPFATQQKFIKTVVKYIKKYNPALTIINSTTIPGTARKIAEVAPAVHSPIRGQHIRMKEDLLFYVKYIGAQNLEWGQKAAAHFQKIGMKTKILDGPEKTEYMKLLETTYYGLLIGWAQQVNRVCKEKGFDYDEMVEWNREIEKRGHARPILRPGVIGGHCVVPNIRLLKKVLKSKYLDAILKSDEWTKEHGN